MAALQAFQLWLQYLSLLGTVNVSLPKSVHWLSQAASFAFSSLTSGLLSTDCLLSPSRTNIALQRLLLRLAVLPLNLLVLAALQTLWWVVISALYACTITRVCGCGVKYACMIHSCLQAHEKFRALQQMHAPDDC